MRRQRTRFLLTFLAGIVVTVLVATHDISLIANMGYDILALKDGSFVHSPGSAV